MPELDHIGIAVKSITQARKLYESLGSLSSTKKPSSRSRSAPP